MRIHTELTLAEFKELLRSGENHFSNIEVIESGELHDYNLDEVVFEECILTLDFSSSTFRKAKVIDSNIKTCIFANANLSNAEFINNSIEHCIFSHADITGITFVQNSRYSSECTLQDLMELVKE
ncbi:hypothetical protein CDO73_01535 [Saccharibacillus sp. O23]|uniref:pentapeptide repeat-containing protein n=1 Tax=Saccharibacillus sp. O23 TaxID=2009338 RepID=UPI000B4E2B50|nr:hypothetical protein CDO73_01535 [Saccharibacillus sp. O23]